MKRKIRFFAYVLLLSALLGTMGRVIQGEAAGRSFKGKNNWLFYNAQGDGSTLYDYKGVNHYSSDGLRRVADNLLAAKKKVNQKGAEFVVYFAPNKETVYSHFMPENIKRKTTYTRYDQLYDYLVLNTDLDVAYPKDELIAYRDKYELYYPTDNHWNPKGQFIGVQELMDITDGKKISIDDVKFKTLNRYYGDLNILSYGKYHFNCRDYKLKTKVKAGDRSKKKVLLVGDSFAGRMSKVAKHYYRKLKFCHINKFRMSMVKGYDVVVWETVERYQDRFYRINFANRPDAAPSVPGQKAKSSMPAETPTASPTPTPASQTAASALELARSEFDEMTDEGVFLIKAKKISASKVKLSWKKGSGKFTFKVYSMIRKGGNYRSPELLTETTRDSYVVSELNKNNSYKFYVRVYFEENGTSHFLKKSIPLVLTTGSKNDLNVKVVTVKKGSTVLYKKQTHKIRYRVKLSGGRLCSRQPDFRYYPADPSVVKVNGKGNITALRKGKTVIFVLASSGAYDKVDVEVKQ